jgi:hypothetical protein
MLDRHAVKLALEGPPHKLIFLNALLSRIYAFLPRPGRYVDDAICAHFWRIFPLRQRVGLLVVGRSRLPHRVHLPGSSGASLPIHLTKAAASVDRLPAVAGVTSTQDAST